MDNELTTDQLLEAMPQNLNLSRDARGKWGFYNTSTYKSRPDLYDSPREALQAIYNEQKNDPDQPKLI